MKLEPRKNLLTVSDLEDTPGLEDWLEQHDGQVFRLRRSKLGAMVFHSLGEEPDARREPINVTSRSPMPIRLISNFAHTPFELDGLRYAGIEGFWQGLKFPSDEDRHRLALLHGSEAKDAGFYAPPADAVTYQGAEIRVGTWQHWELMERACRAKFDQNRDARDALRGTGNRPMVHEMKPDSRTIPGVIMASIWMRIREGLAGT